MISAELRRLQESFAGPVSRLTPGFNTFLGFSKRNRRGALVLSNFLWAPLDVGTTDLGMKLINPDFHPVDFAPLYR